MSCSISDSTNGWVVASAQSRSTDNYLHDCKHVKRDTRQRCPLHAYEHRSIGLSYTNILRHTPSPLWREVVPTTSGLFPPPHLVPGEDPSGLIRGCRPTTNLVGSIVVNYPRSCQSDGLWESIGSRNCGIRMLMEDCCLSSAPSRKITSPGTISTNSCW